jgi:hypothetical protein
VVEGRRRGGGKVNVCGREGGKKGGLVAQWVCQRKKKKEKK